MRRVTLCFLLLLLPSVALAAPTKETLASIRAASATVWIEDEDGKFVSGGSGTITFAKGELWCLTANHVFDGWQYPHSVRVSQHQCDADGKQIKIVFEAAFERWSVKDDLCLLLLDRSSCAGVDEARTYAKLPVWPKSRKPIAVDSSIVHCGSYHVEFHQSIAEGSVRWLGRTIGADGPFDQADISVFGGSSGGGVFSDDGLFVGMAARAIISRTMFYVPSRTITTWLESEGLGDLVACDEASVNKCGRKDCKCGCASGKKCECVSP